jgi:two-component system, OmpR family, phosphate regulon sensor histidine kinase PhoR
LPRARGQRLGLRQNSFEGLDPAEQAGEVGGQVETEAQRDHRHAEENLAKGSQLVPEHRISSTVESHADIVPVYDGLAARLGLFLEALSGLFHGPAAGASSEARAYPEAVEPVKSEREMLRDVIEALPEPTLIVANGKVTLSNSAARALLGMHIEGGDLRLALRHPAAIERLLGDSSDEEQVELVGVGGLGQRWLMSVATFGDGSRFVRLSSRSEAYAAEQMRVDFVANASHELRTPLATILGYAETLREQDGEVDAVTRDRFINIIYDESRRMQRLVEDLISLSRIEAERFRAPTGAVALLPLLREAAENCRNAAEERDCPIDIDVEADLPPVAGDRSQLLQLVENLISNAVLYGQSGRTVHLRAFRERSMAHVSVRDEGEGIAAEHIPRVTERFYRVDPSRSRALGGTGLGLAIVKHIVERHRGRLRIASRVGQGTTVHVQLPLLDVP